MNERILANLSRCEEQCPLLGKANPLIIKMLKLRDDWAKIKEQGEYSLEDIEKLGQDIINSNKEIEEFVDKENPLQNVIDTLKKWLTNNPEELRKIWRSMIETKLKLLHEKSSALISKIQRQSVLNQKTELLQIKKDADQIMTEFDHIHKLSETEQVVCKYYLNKYGDIKAMLKKYDLYLKPLSEELDKLPKATKKTKWLLFVKLREACSLIREFYETIIALVFIGGIIITAIILLS